MKFLSASRMLLISPYAVTFFQQNSSPVLSSGDWKLDPEDLASKFNSKTKAIVVNNPNNPLGKVLKHFIHLNQKCQFPSLALPCGTFQQQTISPSLSLVVLAIIISINLLSSLGVDIYLRLRTVMLPIRTIIVYKSTCNTGIYSGRIRNDSRSE